MLEFIILIAHSNTNPYLGTNPIFHLNFQNLKLLVKHLELIKHPLAPERIKKTLPHKTH